MQQETMITSLLVEMQFTKKLIIYLIILVLFIYIVETGFLGVKDAKAYWTYYCGGLIECYEKTIYPVCEGGENDGDSCTTGCLGGGTCDTNNQIETNATTYGCFSNSDGSCSTFSRGGSNCVNNCTTGSTWIEPKTNPKPVEPPADPDPPNPESTTPPPVYYSCVGCACVPSASGTDYFACALNCGCPPPGDPNAGLSSCKDILDERLWAHEVIKPGDTKTWLTWGKPGGNTAWDRLLNKSPTEKIIKTLTAPDDAYIFHVMVAEPEMELKSFYLLNEDANAWYFYQGHNKPAVVFTGNETILSQLEKDGGYTILDESWVQNHEPSEAWSYPKRAYRTPADCKATWSVKMQRQIPLQGSEDHYGFHLPYQSCAESIGADDHNYFRIDLNSCNPWGTHEKYYNGGDALPAGNFGTGSYLGISKDIEIVRMEGRNWHIAHPGLSPETVWPGNAQTNRDIPSEIRDYSLDYWKTFDPADYFFIYQRDNPVPGSKLDNIFYTVMADGRNAYLKSITMQLPIYALRFDPNPDDNDDVENDLTWAASLSSYPYTPKCDPSSDDHCLVKDKTTKINYFDPKGDDSPAKCTNFSILKEMEDGELKKVAGDSDDPLIPGEEYIFKIDALQRYDNNPWMNQFFTMVPAGTWGSIIGWHTFGRISHFEVVDCRPNCPVTQSIDDNRSLLYGMREGTNLYNSAVFTEWIHTDGDLTNTTIRIEFDMKTEGSVVTLRNTHINRYPFQKVTDPEIPFQYNVPEDSETIVFDIDNNAEYDIPVTGEWAHYVGSATFGPVPNGNNSSMYRIVFRGIEDGTKLYLDNVKATSSKKGQVAIGLRPDGECTTDHQIPTSPGHKALPIEDGSNIYSNTYTLPELTTGTYDLFAWLYDGIDGGCYGHPDYNPSTNTCGLNTAVMDPSFTTNCSDTCSKTVTIESCVDEIAENPTVNLSNNQKICPTLSGGYYAYNVTLSDPTADAESFEILVYKGGETASITDIAKSSFTDKHSATATPNASGNATVSIPALADLGTDLKISVRSSINSCGEKITSGWTTRRYQLGCTVSSTVEAVNSIPANCNSVTGSYTPDPGVEGIVRLDWITEFPWPDEQENPDDGISFKQTPLANGSFTFAQQVPFANPISEWANSYTAKLTITNVEDYACACNKTDNNHVCQINSIDSPSNNTFYVVKANLIYDSWWQTVGGLIFGNNSLSSAIPINDSGTANANCEAQDWCKDHSFINAHPTVVDPDVNDKKAGIPVTNDDAIDTLNGSWWTNRAPSDTGAISAGIPPAIETDRQDYDYFYKLLDLQTVTPRSGDEARFNNSSTPTSPITPFNDGETTKTVYVHYLRPGTGGSSGTVDLIVGDNSNPWNIDTNSKYILVIDGNLRVRQPNTRLTMAGKNSIDIASGGFLMVVASGNITFDKNIGYHCGSDDAGLTCLDNSRGQLIEGIFIASNTMTVESYGTGTLDRKFVGGGTFVGWNNVSLPREFDNDETLDQLARQKNAVSPTEQFFFRPDIVTNTPEAIKTPDLTWKEAN